ncbi:MAG: Nicotine blue oxidoreductase [Acidimicrobiales bacterium]|nr:MAG: nucleotidyltransferase family protein [Actinomycetota bacterium]MBV6509821.1 Nicotine blue oxidoreductase [Acidimicrobiales bacterium]RIK04420.1 MAG: molybdopterin-guanine dinucleotide biosynthesis protein A [Acidobacteriota bacterium]
MSVAAVVLAAGGGRRFDVAGHKLRAPFRGSTVIGSSIAAALAAGLDQTFVVTGAVELGDLLPDAVTVVVNPRWEDGLATSLRAGVAAAGAAGHEAVVIGLGDQPLVTPACWRAVAASESPLATASYGGERRPPVRLAREVWEDLPTAGDSGARRLLGSRPDLVEAVACTGEAADIDTWEDLRAWS